jgi:hypothetical protein
MTLTGMGFDELPDEIQQNSGNLSLHCVLQHELLDQNHLGLGQSEE